MKQLFISLIISLLLFSCLEEQDNPLKKSFLAPTCNDGILNQDEEEIDCGGMCDPCPEPVIAPCTSALENNYLSTDFYDLDIHSVICNKSYGGGNFKVSGSSSNGDFIINFPEDQLPELDKIYSLRSYVDYNDSERAHFKVIFPFSSSFNSSSGELYLTHEGDSIILELCDVTLSNSYTEMTARGRVICE